MHVCWDDISLATVSVLQTIPHAFARKWNEKLFSRFAFLFFFFFVALLVFQFSFHLSHVEKVLAFRIRIHLFHSLSRQEYQSRRNNKYIIMNDEKSRKEKKRNLQHMTRKVFLFSRVTQKLLERSMEKDEVKV